jgi:hypothetical protein
VRLCVDGPVLEAAALRSIREAMPRATAKSTLDASGGGCL